MMRQTLKQVSQTVSICEDIQNPTGQTAVGGPQEVLGLLD